jgi:hypothetical protein
VKFLVEKWYSLTAMVDEWNASVLSACVRSPLQFNCKLVRYCNIWLSFWTRRCGFPRCIPSCGFLTFSQVLWNSDRNWTLILGKD